MLRNPISRALLLAGACLAAITPFFRWGSASGHDFEFHVYSWMEVLDQWKQGILYPRWAALAHWGYGEARFLFYPPASWTLGAALGAFLPWKMAPGAYCWIVLMLSGAAMYRLAREWLAAPDALFAAVFYALNPYHLLIVYWRSAYAELLAAALLPLLLLCILRLKQPGPRPTMWLGLVLAAGWLTNAPAAVMMHYSAAGLALVLVAIGAARKRSWDRKMWRPLVRTALAMAIGAGLASFYLLPAIYEQPWINLSAVLSPGVRPQDNFLFTILADEDHNRFNLLLSIVALAEIGVLAGAIWIWQRKDNAGKAVPSTSTGPAPDCAAEPGATGVDLRTSWLMLTAWGAGSVFLMLPMSNLLWQYLPKFRFVQLPFRWLLCMNAALAMLLAMAAKRWIWTSRLVVCAVLLAVVIVAGYRFQPPWWEEAGDFIDMSDAIADGTGYEGSDEYVPAGGDASELNKSLALVSDDRGAQVPSEMLAWGRTEKHLVVHASQAENLHLRLFNYPAWQVTVNGHPAQAQTVEETGVMIVPILEGTNDVRIHFRRTVDRMIGDAISWVSWILLGAAWIKTRPRRGPGQRM